MVDYVTFVRPSPGQPPFSFEPTLDGNPYLLRVKWNAYGQRWYFDLFGGINGDRVLTRGLIGSVPVFDLNSLTWSHGTVSGETKVPHNLGIASQPSVILLNIAGCQPAAYNGIAIQALITGPKTFTYPLASDPGMPTALGAINTDIDILAGMFAVSRIIYRERNTQFEVWP